MTQKQLIDQFCKFRGKCTTDDVVALNFAYEMLAPRWKSVEDEEPPKGQWIITYEPTSPIVVGTDIILPDETADEHNITHWMPLPSVDHFRETTKMIEKGGEE